MPFALVEADKTTYDRDGFDYQTRPAERFEIPIHERIAAIRRRKAEERARSKTKANRKALHGAASPRSLTCMSLRRKCGARCGRVDGATPARRPRHVATNGDTARLETCATSGLAVR